MFRRFFVLLLLATPLHAALRDDVDAYARRLLATNVTPGFAIAVVEGDRVTYSGAFGLRDVEAQAPVTPDTLFYIASSTKSFTAMAARLLAADGKLDLDAPLSKSIPSLKLTPPLDPARISVRDLLAHRSGISNGAVNFRTAYPGNMTREAMLASLANASSAGSIEFNYSNTNYLLAALAVEQAAGAPWNEVVAKRVFAPLQMQSSFAAMPPPSLPVAYGYVDRGDGRFRRLAPKQERTMHAAGGIFTTASDLGRWIVANLNAGTFPARVLREVHAPQVGLSRRFAHIDRFAYGLGWYNGDYEGDLLVHHFGGYNGLYAHVSFMPERRIGVAVLANGGGDVAEALAMFVYDTLLAKKELRAKYDSELATIVKEATDARGKRESVEARKRERRPLPRSASAYAGTYTSDRLGTIVVREEKGELVAEYGVLHAPLVADESDAFLIDWLENDELEKVRFLIDDKALEWEGRRFVRTSELQRKLDSLLRGFESNGYSGSVLVAKDGEIVLHEGYGFADRERGLRNEAETRYEIASLTKTFTAAAVLQLESAGRLRTSDRLSRFLGPFPDEKAAATIHHLATHTAGLVREGTELASGPDRERFVESVKRTAVESPPGAHYRYTNAGYSMLAAVVEKASGTPFEDYVRAHLIAPAGLQHTGFRTDAQPVAAGYAGNKRVEPEPYEWGLRGAGGMISTVGDLYRWHRALHEGDVVTPQARAKMFQAWPEEGYGWHVTHDTAGRRFIHKGGGMTGFASQILDYPDDRVVIVWTCNDPGQWRQTLNRELTSAVIGTR
ncbi:MAG TPA: serine hydrolase domain-containing protein [Thermoanaerobaculia bacterium]|jgi:CubicO group peptidase (beta-lactamase class C family)